MLPDIIASMLPNISASMIPDDIASMLPDYCRKYDAIHYREYDTLYYHVTLSQVFLLDNGYHFLELTSSEIIYSFSGTLLGFHHDSLTYEWFFISTR